MQKEDSHGLGILYVKCCRAIATRSYQKPLEDLYVEGRDAKGTDNPGAFVVVPRVGSSSQSA
jgi:hypothetical protein